MFNSIKSKSIIIASIVFVSFVLALITPAASTAAFSKIATFEEGQFLVKFMPGTPADTKRSINASNAVDEKDFIPGLDVYVMKTPKGKSAKEMALIYSNNKNVKFAEPDYIASSEAVPNDPYFNTNQVGLNRLSPCTGWDISKGSVDISVAVLDTGVALNHPDLAGKFTNGYDFVNNDNDPTDDKGHGTMVSGIIGASTDNGVGISGTVWNTTIIPVKVLGSDGNGTYSNIAKGITYAADKGAKVINLSLSGTTSSSTLQSAVNYAFNKGAVIVASAGNTNSAVGYPAACTNVIAVAAVDNYDVKSTYSSYGSEVFITAPGNSVNSTIYTGGYGSGSGTSFSAPFVSGLSALILSVNPSFSPTQVGDIIKQGAKDLGEPGHDSYYGWGRIDIYKSLAIASGLNPEATPTPAPSAVPTPTSTPIPTPTTTPVPTITPTPSPTPYTVTGSVTSGKTVKAISQLSVNEGATIDLSLRWDIKKTNLDLYLYDNAGVLIRKSSTSTSASTFETITSVMPKGEYVVKIVSVSGKANYVLTVNCN